MPKPLARVCLQDGLKLDLNRLCRQGFVRPGTRTGPQYIQWNKAERVDPRIEHEFHKVFMTTSKEGKEALIGRWIDKKKCSRGEAMRLAIEEWRRENR